MDQVDCAIKDHHNDLNRISMVKSWYGNVFTSIGLDNDFVLNKRQDIILTNEILAFPLQSRHNGHDSVSNHQRHHCLLNRLFGCRSKKTSKLRVTGLCVGNPPGTAQMASNAENVSIWWRHHAMRWRQQSLADFPHTRPVRPKRLLSSWTADDLVRLNAHVRWRIRFF